MLAAARGLAEIIAGRQTQIVEVDAFFDFFPAKPLGVPVIVVDLRRGRGGRRGSC